MRARAGEMWLKKGEVTVQVAQRFELTWSRERRQWWADESNTGIRDWLAKQQYTAKIAKTDLPGWGGAKDMELLKVPKSDEKLVRSLGAEKRGAQWFVKKGLGLARFQRWLVK